MENKPKTPTPRVKNFTLKGIRCTRVDDELIPTEGVVVFVFCTLLIDSKSQFYLNKGLLNRDRAEGRKPDQIG